MEFENLSEQQKIIIEYLEHSYSGAQMMNDDESMTRIDRAIRAFYLDPNKTYSVKELLSKEQNNKIIYDSIY